MSFAPDNELTAKVLRSYSKIENARLRAIVAALIKHVHACLTEMKLTDENR